MFSISFAPISFKVGGRSPRLLPECAPQPEGLVSEWVTGGDIPGQGRLEPRVTAPERNQDAGQADRRRGEQSGKME